MRVENLLVHVRSSELVGMPSALLLQSVFPILHFGLLTIRIPENSMPEVEAILEKCGRRQSARLWVTGEVVLESRQDVRSPDALIPTEPIKYEYILRASEIEDCWGPAAY